MKAILVMYDTLNRHFLPPYGCDWVHAPNFERLTKKAVTFTNAYAGSLPCIPARRELHTGRYNFLHRCWGPLEPFDDSMPEVLKTNGVYTHLVSDHLHYWEDGGSTYHTRFNSWEISRGQEGDHWKGEVRDPKVPEQIGRSMRQDEVNRKYMQNIESQPQHKTFDSGLDFIQQNCREDNWFLHLETFDPHEPFFTIQKYKDLYVHEYDGPRFDWPASIPVSETDEQIRHCRYEYAALVSMCDEYLGKILDLIDSLDLWKDTMLIVNTDHGYLLGEHGWWGKDTVPYYNEIAHIPLFIWDPRCGRKNHRCECLVQTIDLPATLLEFFDVPTPEDMQGVPLTEVLSHDHPVREAGLFGLHGGLVQVTDGRWVYMRAATGTDNTPIFNYTLMPTHMTHRFSVDELQGMELHGPFSFTKDCRVLKINAQHTWKKWQDNYQVHRYGHLLFDLAGDPEQLKPMKDSRIEAEMIDHMVRLMKENDAPVEQYERLGLAMEL
jgi:arylsulfatase A-like enzyme